MRSGDVSQLHTKSDDITMQKFEGMLTIAAGKSREEPYSQYNYLANYIIQLHSIEPSFII